MSKNRENLALLRPYQQPFSASDHNGRLIREEYDWVEEEMVRNWWNSYIIAQGGSIFFTEHLDERVKKEGLWRNGKKMAEVLRYSARTSGLFAYHRGGRIKRKGEGI
jgi:predicted metal-dependent HD superfamily phosphohydrolase